MHRNFSSNYKHSHAPAQFLLNTQDRYEKNSHNKCQLLRKNMLCWSAKWQVHQVFYSKFIMNHVKVSQASNLGDKNLTANGCRSSVCFSVNQRRTNKENLYFSDNSSSNVECRFSVKRSSERKKIWANPRNSLMTWDFKLTFASDFVIQKLLSFIIPNESGNKCRAHHPLDHQLALAIGPPDRAQRKLRW